MENTKTILVVEDEKSLRETLCLKLAHSGFDTLEAKDGEEGLNFSLDKHPDLILLDLMLPKIDGMTMLKKIREDSWGKTVPVIILTNLSDHDDQRNKDIAKLEPTYYLVKANKTLAEVIEKIKERLGLLQ